MMSTDADVYNPGSQPASNPVSVPHLNSNSNQNEHQLSSIQRTCSVRGCNQALLSESTNKMCEGCRGRHRIYATTKRARRKLEKAAVVGIRRVGDQPEASNVNASVQTQLWTQPPSSPSQDSTTTTMTNENTPVWDNSAIDPQLFAESPATSLHSLVSAYPQPPYPPSSSSELAGALTLPASSSHNEINQHYQSHALEKKDDHYEMEEREVAQALQATEHVELAAVATNHNPAQGAVPQKPCSVKGCKAMIPLSSTFKMCTPCRTRYRTYGNTKRAKWKAEREAFDLELTGLGTKEDQKEETTGDRSISGPPEDLRHWELSLMNDRGPRHSTGNGIPGNSAMSLDDPMTAMQATLYPDESSAEGTGYTHTVGNATHPIPVRMCTVSHCHKVLPGSYRYKRCEQHRLQNRYHSQLKRVREMGKKAVMLETALEENGLGPSLPEEANQSDQEQEESSLDSRSKPDIKHIKRHVESNKKSRKRRSTCSTRVCCNLLAPGVCWRQCDVCRALKRVLKREKTALEENPAKGEERLKEIVELMSPGVIQSGLRVKPETFNASGGMEQNEKVTESSDGAVGNKEGSDEIIMAAISTAPRHVSTEVISAANPNISMLSNITTETSTSFPQMFQSVFRADITAPSTASADVVQAPSPLMSSLILGAHSDPVVTQNTDGGSQLTFREYKPKMRTGGGGPGMSHGAEVFREMVQKDQQTSIGMIGPPSYHVYKSTPPPPRPASTSATPVLAPEPAPTTSVLIISKPLFKVASRTQDSADGNFVSENPSNTDTPAAEPVQPSAIATTAVDQKIASDQPSEAPAQIASTPSPSPPSIVIPRRRKPRVSRAKPTPDVPAAPPHTVLPYPYPPSHYPYPYYMPPYTYSMPRSSPFPAPTTLPYSPLYSYSYPYPYAPHLGNYAAGFGYMQPPQYPLGSYPQSQTYLPQHQAYASANQYMYPHSKDLPIPYRQPPLVAVPSPEKQNKRKRYEGVDEQTTRTAERPASTAGMIQPYTLYASNIGVESSKRQGPPETPRATVPIPTFVEHTALLFDSSEPSKTSAPPLPIATRLCAHKNCRRVIPVDHHGTLCDRCRVRIKRHQAKARQRFKLEPRKSMLMGRATPAALTVAASANTSAEVP